MKRPYKYASTSELALELHLRRGPSFQCQSPDCRSFEDGHGRFDTCPSCGRKGYLSGAFVRDESSPQWKDWERRTFERYRQVAPNGRVSRPLPPSALNDDEQSRSA